MIHFRNKTESINQTDSQTNMTSCLINKLELLDLSEKHKFIETNNAIMDVLSMIEQKLNVKINQPMSEKLRAEIKSKLVAINSSWNKLTTLHYKDMFRKEIAKRTLKIRIPSCDFSEDSLKSRFEIMQEEFNDAKAENYRLEKSMKELNAELFDLKCKLHNSQTRLSLGTSKYAQEKAFEIIQQTSSTIEQASAIATLDLQARLQGKRHTIKNILLSPDVIELDSNETDRPCTSSSQPTTIRNMTSGSDNFAKFMSYARKSLDPKDKSKQLNGVHYPNLAKLTKLSQRKNYYLVSERQKVRLKQQIKGTVNTFIS